MTASKQQIIAYKTLLNQSNLKAEEQNLLSGYNVTTCKDLSTKQIGELIDYLSKRAKPVDAHPILRKARSRVLALLTDMGHKTHGDGWNAINTFVAQPRIAGKRLYDMDADELGALAKKLHLLIKKAAEKRLADERSAQCN